MSNATNVAITPGHRPTSPKSYADRGGRDRAEHPGGASIRSASATCRELIALAKAKPDQLFFGSVGVGSHAASCRRIIQGLADVKLTHVPYAGGSDQAATDLIAGRISMMFSPQSTIAPHIDAGSVKALAAATASAPACLPTCRRSPRPAAGFDSASEAA